MDLCGVGRNGSLVIAEVLAFVDIKAVGQVGVKRGCVCCQMHTNYRFYMSRRVERRSLSLLADKSSFFEIPLHDSAFTSVTYEVVVYV